MKIQFKVGNKTFKESPKELAKKFRKGNYALLPGNWLSNLMELLRVEYGEGQIELARNDSVKIVKAIGKQNKKQSEKEQIQLIEIKCDLLNKIESATAKINADYTKLLEPYVGNKLFTKSGDRSALLKKVDALDPGISLKKKLVHGAKLSLNVDKFWAIRQGDWFTITLNFIYKVPFFLKEQKYQKTLYVGFLQDESQVLKEIKTYEPIDKVDANEQIQLLKEQSRLETELSAIREKLVINRYF